MKRRSWLAGLALCSALGCSANDPESLDTRLVKVKIVTVWTDMNYKETDNIWSTIYPNTVVERLDTGERRKIRGGNWGGTGDVFSIRVCDFRWK